MTDLATELKQPGETEIAPVKNAEQVYLRILGLDHLPDSPEELPQRLIIPPEALGSFEQAIIQTLEDGHERAQAIGWNPKSGYEYSSLIRGEAYTTGRRETLFRVLNSFFGKKNNKLSYPSVSQRRRKLFSWAI